MNIDSSLETQDHPISSVAPLADRDLSSKTTVGNSIVAVIGILGLVGVYRYAYEDELETLQPLADPTPSAPLHTLFTTPLKTFPHQELYRHQFIQNFFSIDIANKDPQALSSHKGISEVTLKKGKGEVIGRAYLSLGKEKNTQVLIQLDTLNLLDIIQIKKLFEQWKSCNFFFEGASLALLASPAFQGRALKKTNYSLQKPLLDAEGIKDLERYLLGLNMSVKDFFDKEGKRVITLKDSKQTPVVEAFFEQQKGSKPKVTLNFLQAQDLDFLFLKNLLEGPFSKKVKSLDLHVSGHLMKNT